MAISMSSRNAVRLADRLVLAVGVHPGKTPLFSARRAASHAGRNLRAGGARGGLRMVCTTFADLVVAAAHREVRATILIRGVRDATDFDYEMQMAGMNAAMAPQIADGVSAGIAGGSPDHRHSGAPDRRHGRRRFEPSYRRRSLRG